MAVEVMAAAAAVAATLLGGGGIATFVKVLIDQKAGVKSAEREARRDMIADRDGLIQTLLTRTEAQDRRLSSLEEDKSFLDRIREAYSDHIDALEAFSWAVYRGEAQPPPPKRPVVVRKEQ